MTDFDAQSRRLVKYWPEASEVAIALREAYAAGASEMREKIARMVLASSIDGVASERLAGAIRALEGNS